MSDVQSIAQQAPTLSRLFAGGIGVLRSHRSRNLLSTTELTAGCIRVASRGLCVRQSLQQAPRASTPHMSASLGMVPGMHLQCEGICLCDRTLHCQTLLCNLVLAGVTEMAVLDGFLADH